MSNLRKLKQLAGTSGLITLAKFEKARVLFDSLHGWVNNYGADKDLLKIKQRFVEANAQPIVICLTGKRGAGKTTIADYMVEAFKGLGFSVERRAMADPLKVFATSMGWDGKKDEKGRRLLQLLGTECGRECIGASTWTDKWLAGATESKPKVVIVDDVRFDNEHTTVEKFAAATGARFYHIEAAGRGIAKSLPWYKRIFDRASKHASEQSLTIQPDMYIDTTDSHINDTDNMLTHIVNFSIEGLL